MTSPVRRAEKHYTVAETAEILDLSPHFIRNHLRELPHSRFGRLVRFYESDIAKIIEQAKHTPDAPRIEPVAPVRTGPVPLRPGGRRAS